MLTKKELKRLIELEREIFDSIDDEMTKIWESGRLTVLEFLLQKYYKD